MFCTKALMETYKGDEGRKKARIAVLCLMSRDSLTLRLRDVEGLVYWLQGEEDKPFGCLVQYGQIEL